jgi:hypothetical protein
VPKMMQKRFFSGKMVKTLINPTGGSLFPFLSRSGPSGGGGEDPQRPWDFKKETGHRIESPVLGSLKEMQEENNANWKQTMGHLFQISSNLGLYAASNHSHFAAISSQLLELSKGQEEIRKELSELKSKKAFVLPAVIGISVGLGVGFYIGFRYNLPSSLTEEEAEQAGYELARILGRSIRIVFQ